MSANPSAKDLMKQWSDGEESAAELLHRRYAMRLLAFAKSYLSAKICRRVDADEVIQSVFLTFFKRARAGQYAVDHSGALWRLLQKIAIRKAVNRVQFHRAQKRDVGTEVSLDQVVSSSEFTSESGLEDALAIADGFDWVVRQLAEPEPAILELWMQECTVEETARQIGTTVRTVQRTRKRIRELLKRHFFEKF